MKNPLSIWKRTYYAGKWFRLIEISIQQTNNEGGSYIFDTISCDGNEKATAKKFLKQVKKAKSFEDCERVYRKMFKRSSDLFTDYYGRVKNLNN